VQDLNASVQMFPSNLIASVGDFKQADFFQLSDADAAAKDPVKVQF
jgi:hypothetical protein